MSRERRKSRGYNSRVRAVLGPTDRDSGGGPVHSGAKEVVPGGVVLLSAGSLIHAEGVLLEEPDFYVNHLLVVSNSLRLGR